MKGLVIQSLRILVVIIAAVALILPWSLRSKYSALLRWIRNLLMNNSRAIRQWALHTRWSWDKHE